MWRDFDLVKLSHFHIASKNNFFEIRISQGMIVQVLWLIPKASQSYAFHSKFFKTEDGLQVSSHF